MPRLWWMTTQAGLESTFSWNSSKAWVRNYIQLSVYPSLRLSFCLSVCLSVCLSIWQPIYLSLSIQLSVYPSVCLSVYPSVCLSVSVYPSVCLSICLCLSSCLSIHLSACLSVSVYPAVCLSICLSVQALAHFVPLTFALCELSCSFVQIFFLHWLKHNVHPHFLLSAFLALWHQLVHW